jgi:hypothetical protein
MSLQITFNGKTYQSLDEMPPEARQAYEQALRLLADQNANGVPDFLDGLAQGQSLDDMLRPLNVLSAANTQIVYNGQTYTNLHDMPPEARQAYQQAMRALDQNGNGVPDTLEPGAFQAGVLNVASAQPASAPRPVPMPYTPASLEPEGPSARAAKLRGAAIIVLVLTGLLLAAAVFLVVVGPAILGLR